MPRESIIGGLCALGTFLLWGLMPLYFKALAHVPPLEVLAHRVVWSVLLLLVLVALWRRGPVIREALRDRRTRLLLGASTLLISSNWLIFIWAVGVGRVLEISLGYYINPLLNVLLGLVLLRERLSRTEAVAVALAAAGVLNLTLQAEGFPWVSLVLAGSFGVYGLIRKTIRLNSVEGLFLETTLLLPLALGYLVALQVSGAASFAAGSASTNALLALAGIVTAVPLLLFTSAVRRLNYATVGFFQYIAPTGHFLLAVFVFGEVFTPAHLISFGLIWTALAVVSAHSLSVVRRRPA